MGNSCCGLHHRASSAVWAAGDDGVDRTYEHDDDPGQLRSASSIANKQVVVVEKQSLLGFQNKLRASSSKNSSSSSSNAREVKINISKSQLLELLRRADVHSIPVDQVLSRLMNAAAGDHNHVLFERPWRPVLQTIPELN